MKTMTSQITNEEKKNAFGQKLIGQLNGAGLMMMLSLGHRTGLLDTLGRMPAATSEEIAKEARLNERYVRESLGAFVTAQVVEYDAQRKTYYLPPEHAVWLTRGAAMGNLAATAQWFAVLGSVEDRIVDCFKNGGGARYEDYHRFHEVMAEESHQTVVQPMLEHLIPLVPGLKEKLEKGIEVLDLGCGSGYALVHLAGHFPNSRFTGYDLCEDAVERARQEAAERELTNITFEARNVAEIRDEQRFDLIFTFDAIHDQANPAKVLRNIYRALKDDGLYFMQDIAGSSHVHQNMDHPLGTLLYTISCMHCMSVSLGQEGDGLGAMWGKEKALEMLKEAGFGPVAVKQLDHDIMNYYYLVRKN